MKQYCRYCSNYHTGNGNWCDELNKTMSDATAMSINHCDSFDFCEIDAYDIEHIYKPRDKNNNSSNYKQITLFE